MKSKPKSRISIGKQVKLVEAAQLAASGASSGWAAPEVESPHLTLT
jgi:hypothetical protein